MKRSFPVIFILFQEIQDINLFPSVESQRNLLRVGAE